MRKSGWFETSDTMEPMSGLDSAFLFLETPTSPMHIGSLAVIEGSLKFDEFREHLASRLHLVKSLRQRLVFVPFGLDRPYWAMDPNFNIDWHLHHTMLPRPGGWRQLRKLCSRIFSQPLDRSRPLWEIVFVEGLDAIPQVPPNSVAIISKIHHAAVDGMSGADIMNALYDLSPEPREVDPPTELKAEPIPSDLEILAKSAAHLISRPLKLRSLIAETAKTTIKAGALHQVGRVELPTMPFQAPHTPLNNPISSNRVWNTALLQLDRIKRLKRIMGCSVNDVILAICSGALRRYLDEEGHLPPKPLVSMVPISTRSEEQKDSLGNQISAMLVQLATDIDDPVERLKQIHKNTSTGKAYHKAMSANALLEYSEFVPFGLAGRAARMYARSELSRHHRPLFNCTITNVPGPQVPLYLTGHRLLALMGMAPIVEGMGLIITIFSYDGVVSISPTSSPQIMPNIDTFTKYIWLTANELEEAILKLDIAEPIKEREKVDIQLRDVFMTFQSHLQEHPKMKLPSSKIYQFKVTGDQSQEWVFNLQSTPPQIEEGTNDDAICTLRMDTQHVTAMLTGELDGTAAFMQGKLKVDGDINQAIKFGKVLKTFSRQLENLSSQNA